MRAIFETKQFRKDLKRQRKRGKDLEKLKTVIRTIASGGKLDAKHRDHALSGDWLGSRDCRVEADWILIYRIDNECLFLERMGTHNDLFKK